VYRVHLVGVDVIFVLSYLHLLKKVYLGNYHEADLDGWFTGVFAFLVFHIVVFLGITLSTNHLGDVTITIAANIYWSLFLFTHKAYAAVFTNKHLNVDQLTRFMIGHYLAAYFYTYLLQAHLMFIHEAWDADSALSTQQDSTSPKLTWLWDALAKEALMMLGAYVLLVTTFIQLAYPDPRAVNYTFFEQWSEAESEELNYFIVAPHWYFRPHMGLLTACAQHYEGLFWLVGFYVALAALPAISRGWGSSKLGAVGAGARPTAWSRVGRAAFVTLVLTMAYVGGSLPCGRFYYEGVEGFFGNSVTRLSYQYIYLYLFCVCHALERVEGHLREASVGGIGVGPGAKPGTCE
jgi:quinol-cytochrome oxidoreductase complex cytochrome b subunit